MEKGRRPEGGFDLGRLVKLAQENVDGTVEGRKLPPVHDWHPENCGKMDMVIKSDGSWWHEGSPITRPKLINLFQTILRKDGDDYFLVTPAEKIEITVERAPFLATRVDAEGEGKAQSLFFTINNGDTVEAGPQRPLRVEIDPDTQEPAPFILVRDRLEAAINRPAFYELVELAEERDGALIVHSQGTAFELGKV
jgi:hypothetical protein